MAEACRCAEPAWVVSESGSVFCAACVGDAPPGVAAVEVAADVVRRAAGQMTARRAWDARHALPHRAIAQRDDRRDRRVLRAQLVVNAILVVLAVAWAGTTIALLAGGP